VDACLRLFREKGFKLEAAWLPVAILTAIRNWKSLISICYT
jgi:hypothetical protein